MSADDVRETLAMAVAKTGGTKVHVRHRPRLFSDNGPCYLSHELKDYLDKRGIIQHPLTRRRRERSNGIIDQSGLSLIYRTIIHRRVGERDRSLRGII